jgi:hypothetical protein
MKSASGSFDFNGYVFSLHTTAQQQSREQRTARRASRAPGQKSSGFIVKSRVLS